MHNADWHELFALTASVLEIIVRGTVMYWFLFLIFRFPLRRDVGSPGIADVLFLVLIADASQNAMTGEHKSIVDGIALVTTIAFWNYAVDWIGYRVPFLERMLQAPPVMLVRGGRIIRRNLRKEMLSEDELMAKVREAGLAKLTDVAEAYIESDGQISVIRRER